VSDVRAFARNPDGSETDITEGVQALYDLVINSMDWGSGFLTAEDARPVALLARTMGFEQAEEAERYLRDQEHSEQQSKFLRERGGYAAMVTRVGAPLPHDHVFSTAGRCMWPQCRELGEMDPL
jgi:hypothetical protein